MWRRQPGGLLETYRWPLAGSVAALIVGLIVAALILAFCGGEGEDEGPAAVTTPRPTRTVGPRTVTAADRTATAVASGTPGTPGPTVTTAPGEPPTAIPGLPTETPSLPGPPEASPTPGAPGPTAPPGTATPASPSPTFTPRPTSTPSATPTPVQLPDLVIRDLGVHYDRIWVRIGNDGEGKVPAGREVEVQVRGVVGEPVTLTEDLLPGTSARIVLEDLVIYKPERVLAVVDPNNLIPEEDDNNNGLVKELVPDIALDLAAHGVLRTADTHRLQVVIWNPTYAPAIDVTVVVTVFLWGATDPTDRFTHQLTIEPLGFETVEMLGAAALPGAQVRVVVEMTDPPDANPANNVFEGLIP